MVSFPQRWGEIDRDRQRWGKGEGGRGEEGERVDIFFSAGGYPYISRGRCR